MKKMMNYHIANLNELIKMKQYQSFFLMPFTDMESTNMLKPNMMPRVAAPKQRRRRKCAAECKKHKFSQEATPRKEDANQKKRDDMED